AVWNCGVDKSPGPDGFTFKFIKHYWDSVRKDFIDMVKNFKTYGSIPKGCNSSFIALVPNIQDPLHTTNYRPICLIGCQYKVTAKVLGNRLLQVVVEALHVTFLEPKAKYIFKGVKVGNDNVEISHLQLTDDALILEEWPHENAKNLCRLLRCFHLASRLKVNFSKSKIFRVGATIGDTNLLASFLCCQPYSLPFTYLGLPIGANMNISCNWKPIIDKFHNRLSSWKARSLSFGGRLTLLKFIIGALGTYYFSPFKAPKCVISYLEKLRHNFFLGGSMDNKKLEWVAWKQVYSSKDYGGLTISSLLASNLPC
nr:hypothetical protein [Tanacetum cinerariifolium]